MSEDNRENNGKQKWWTVMHPSRIRDSGQRLRSRLSWLLNPGTDLGHRTANAGFWAFALNITNRVLSTARTVLIARLLAPEDLGLMGIALLMVSFLNTFTRTGFRAALIQRKGSIEDDLDTAWTIEFLRRFMLGGVLALAAPWFADFFGAPEVVNVIRVMGLVVFVNGLQNIAVLKFDKELEFQRRFIYRSIPALADLVTAVAFAIVLRSVWALVLGLLARNLTLVIASYVVLPYRARLRIDWSRAKRLFSFGFWIFGSNILVWLTLSLDDVVVGRVLTVAALGFYQLAFTISQVVTSELTSVINQVAFPVYSKLQDAGERLRKAYLRTFQLVTLVSIPMTLGLWFIGKEMVEVVLGPKWLPMLPAFNVLLVWGLIRSILATTGPLFQGIGRPSIATSIQLGQVVLLAAVIYPFTTAWDVVGAAWATVVAAVIPSLVAVVLAVRTVGAQARSVTRLLFFPLINASIMLGVLMTVEVLVGPVSPLVLLLWAPPTGLIVYVSGVWLSRRLFGYTADGILLSPRPG